MTAVLGVDSAPTPLAQRVMQVLAQRCEQEIDDAALAGDDLVEYDAATAELKALGASQ